MPGLSGTAQLHYAGSRKVPRNVDALEAYFAGSGLWCERYNCPAT